MAADVYMKQNDRLPLFDYMLKDNNQQPLDLTGGTVTFVMANAQTGAIKVNAAAIVVDATLGKVRYDWAVGDTNMLGETEQAVYYNAEWQVTLSGKVMKVPSDGHIKILITRSLA